MNTRPRAGHVSRRTVLGAVLAVLTASLAQEAAAMKPDISNPASIYPGDPDAQSVAKLVLRDDARALAAALGARPELVHATGIERIGLLLFAVYNRKPESVRVLMRAGADPFLSASPASALGVPALIAMMSTKSPDTFSVMLESGLDVNGGRDEDVPILITESMVLNDDRRFRQLLATGKVNPNVQDDAGNTPLNDAVDAIKYDMALALLEIGADPRLGRRNVLKSLARHEGRWRPGTEVARDYDRLVERLRKMGMTAETPTRPAPVRPLAAVKQ